MSGRPALLGICIPRVSGGDPIVTAIMAGACCFPRIGGGDPHGDDPPSRRKEAGKEILPVIKVTGSLAWLCNGREKLCIYHTG